MAKEDTPKALSHKNILVLDEGSLYLQPFSPNSPFHPKMPAVVVGELNFDPTLDPVKLAHVLRAAGLPPRHDSEKRTLPGNPGPDLRYDQPLAAGSGGGYDGPSSGMTTVPVPTADPETGLVETAVPPQGEEQTTNEQTGRGKK